MAKEKLVKARVLLDSRFGKCNDVVELPAADIASGVEAGELDAHVDSVKYAESLKAAK